MSEHRCARVGCRRVRMLLLDWYYEDDIVDTQTAEWRDVEKMGDRYRELLALGIDPLDDETREEWRSWRKSR